MGGVLSCMEMWVYQLHSIRSLNSGGGGGGGGVGGREGAAMLVPLNNSFSKCTPQIHQKINVSEGLFWHILETYHRKLWLP